MSLSGDCRGTGGLDRRVSAFLRVELTHAPAASILYRRYCEVAGAGRWRLHRCIWLRCARCCAQDTAEFRAHSTSSSARLCSCPLWREIRVLLQTVPNTQFLDQLVLMPVMWRCRRCSSWTWLMSCQFCDPAVSAAQAMVSQLVLTSGGFRAELSEFHAVH